MKNSIWRLWALYCVSSLVALGLAVGGLLLIDLAIHKKLDAQFGYNIRGYRGPPAGEKQPGEIRIATFGGSTTFGYGVYWFEAWPAQLETLLKAQYPKDSEQEKISVVNLGFNSQGIFGIRADLDIYDALNFDIAIIYNGYNDAQPYGSGNKFSGRLTDTVFMATGYMFILPVYLQEKSNILIEKWKLREIFGKSTPVEQKIVFVQPDEKKNEILRNHMSISNLAQNTPIANSGTTPSEPYQHYLAYFKKTVDRLLSKGKQVVVVCQPIMCNGTQQKMLRKFLEERYSGRITYLYDKDISELDTKDQTLSFDAMHLTARGNAIISKAMLPTAQKLVEKVRLERP